jgi:hypothetical protein
MKEKGSLFEAILNQDEVQVKQLLNQGIDPNALDARGEFFEPPLYYALKYISSTSIVESLIASKADVHYRARSTWNKDAISLLRVCDRDSKANVLLHHGVRLTKEDETYFNDSAYAPFFRNLLDAYRIMGERVARCRRLCIAALRATPIQQRDLRTWWIREMVWSTRRDPIWTPDLPMPDGYT